MTWYLTKRQQKAALKCAVYRNMILQSKKVNAELYYLQKTQNWSNDQTENWPLTKKQTHPILICEQYVQVDWIILIHPLLRNLSTCWSEYVNIYYIHQYNLYV